MASRTPSRSLRSASSASIPSIVDKSEANISAHKEKADLIKAACDASDITTLVDLATSSNGLLADSLRRTAWPILLGCPAHGPDTQPWRELPVHREEEQVAKDVDRAFVHYPKESDRQLDRRKEELSDVITQVLRCHPYLYYFQGYHDIVQVIYLVLGAHAAPPAVTRLSLLRIRDFMLPSLDAAVSHLELLPPVLRAADPELYNHLPRIPPHYALGATLTLFSHVIEEYGDITRLFDFFLASDTIMPIYFFAAILLSRREELFELDKDEGDDIFFVMLGKLPKPFEVELHISRTLALYTKVPPQSLCSWPWWISTSSVLKAKRTPFEIANTSIAEGEALFEKQLRDQRIHQAYSKSFVIANRFKLQLWRNRRPGAIGLAVFVGVIAFWLGKGRGNSGTEFIRKFMGVFV